MNHRTVLSRHTYHCFIRVHMCSDRYTTVSSGFTCVVTDVPLFHQVHMCSDIRTTVSSGSHVQ